ncbi:maltose ABC transporter permease MalF [Reinekea marina]|uniref:Maltose/maltodextrin transport system permease protein n=1 Tax=Reinekea marina TaxID=1310421 RepID=A0ABV7WTX0_9GAMM|nr:maltose ABC transporter permease MalF [Reinekea marina]MDN3647303.1 maltose ABC transporter permease MalF [Reinekea marina]MDN3651059.1 maltose ABC transporter permease MalF [Reinekea marina]
MANANAIPMAPEMTAQERWKTVIQYGLVCTLSVFFLYITFLMYAQGEMLYAGIMLVFTCAFAFVFTSDRAYVWRYIFPSLVGVSFFIIMPILYTLGLTFTNKSNLHLLEYEQAKNYFLSQTYIAEGSESYGLKIYHQGDQFHLALVANDDQMFITQDPIGLDNSEAIKLPMVPINEEPALEEAPRKSVITYRQPLADIKLVLPNGTELAKSKLREYAEIHPLWIAEKDDVLVNQDTGEQVSANFETGFFELPNGDYVSPGFQVNVGLDNYIRVVTDKDMLKPFLSIFTWTIFFSIFSVAATFMLGIVLASFVQWDPIKGRSIYQLLLILPYSVPAFILMLVFKALFNQNFGQINHALDALFQFQVAWDTDITMSKTKILLVNVYLGYPYMFILCLGMLQSIPKDLYEASSLEGANPIVNFFKITLPLIIKPLLPLLIASFAFNFNNFVLIQLLTRGAPLMLASNPPAGGTDLLVNYAYRLAFLGDTQDYALGATISTFIFVMIGIMAVFYLKALKVKIGVQK